MARRLEGQIAVVTGGATGIGLATAGPIKTPGLVDLAGADAAQQQACSTTWLRPSRSGVSVIPMTSPAPPPSSRPRTQASSPEPNSSSTADKPRPEQTDESPHPQTASPPP